MLVLQKQDMGLQCVLQVRQQCAQSFFALLLVMQHVRYGNARP